MLFIFITSECEIGIMLKKTVVLIMFVTICSKMLGFGRELALSYLYGASNISDAYLVSITIPNVIIGFVSAGIVAGFIPMYSKVLQSNGEAEANKFTNNLINLLLIIITIIIIVLFLFTKEVVGLFASGFEGETLELTVKFTKISLLAIYFTTLVAMYKGFVELKNNFIISALIGFPLNIIILLSLFISSKYSLLALPTGFVFAIIAQLLLLLYFARKAGYKYEMKLNIKDQHTIRMAYIALPIILGTSVNQINILVDRTLASRITVGGISALNYADRLNQFVLGIFVVSIITVLYPTISKMAAENNIKGLKKTISEAITGVNLLVLPAMVGSIIFASQIVSLLFGRGAFDGNAILLTSSALMFYSIGMIGFGLREVLARAFYSLQDSKTPMINAAMGMILNIILNLILSRYLGIGGLALATSIAAIFTTVLLFISLRKKIGPFGIRKVLISFIKILFASLLMGFIAKVSFNYLIIAIGQNIALLIAIAIGAVSYFVIIYFMKIEDVEVIVNAIKRKLGKTSASL